MKKTTIFWTAILGLGLLLLAPHGQSQSPVQLKDQDEVVRQQMIAWTKDLGVTCTECHQVTNFRDDAKPSFKVALMHQKFVEVLKANGMDGNKAPEASCFTCHQGKLKPPRRPKSTP